MAKNNIYKLLLNNKNFGASNNTKFASVMKINSVGGFNLNFTSNLKFKTNETQKSNFSLQTSPILRSLTSDQVSFTGINAPIPFFLKNLDNIPCPCCGIKMIKSSDFAKLDDTVLSKSSRNAVEALSKFEESMHPIEKSCFKILKKLSNEAPRKQLNDLLLSVRGGHLENLKLTEFKILDQLDEVGKKLSKNSAKFLNEITKTSRKLIMGEGQSDFFRRKTVLKNVFNLKARIQEKEVADELYKIAQKLPSSGDDMDAFIVKYSERTSKEIGQRLVSSSIGTVEHIKPKFNGGEGSEKNYILECAGCNNPRGNQPFSEFVAENPGMVHNIPEGTDMNGLSLSEWFELHPEHKGNVQKNMDVVIDKINSGLIKGYNWYPATVSKTLEDESKGAIKLDISKLKYNPGPRRASDELVEKYNPKQEVVRQPAATTLTKPTMPTKPKLVQDKPSETKKGPEGPKGKDNNDQPRSESKRRPSKEQADNKPNPFAIFINKRKRKA